MPDLRIVDYLGRPVNVRELTKEVAIPSATGLRSIWRESVATGLTAETLATIITEVDQNDILNYLTLAEEMEERDLHYHSVLSTRKLAVSGLDVIVESCSDDAEYVKHADFVREVIQDDAFAPLLDQQLDALGKGYAVSEIMWERGEPMVPRGYKWRDQRHFQFDREQGEELRLVDERDPVNGLALTPYRFCIHRPRIKMGLTIRSGLARLAVVAYMCKGYTMKDWMAFAEVFGMPLRIGRYDTAATTEQKAALANAVNIIGADAGCTIPKNMEIEFVSAEKSTGGEKLFVNLANWLDSQVSKGVLGQTATTEGTPGRLGSDDAQHKVREDIKLSDAKQLAATLRRDIVKPLIDLNFGAQEAGNYPKLRLFTEEPEDLEGLSKSLPEFIDRGLKVQASVIRDKFGLEDPEDDAELLQPKSGGMSKPDNPEDEPGPEPPLPPAPEPDELEQTLHRERHETILELMQMVRKGETLTADQRVLLATSLAAAQSTTVQSLILSKERFQTREAAKSWATKHKYHATKVDETENSWRFRQREPGDFKPNSFRTIELTNGVKAVIGRLKTETAREEPDDEDEIDRLADEALGDWKRLMDPVLQPVLEHAKASGSYQEFLEGLEDVMAGADSTLLAEHLAVATFKARGLGDGTDDV